MSQPLAKRLVSVQSKPPSARIRCWHGHVPARRDGHSLVAGFPMLGNTARLEGIEVHPLKDFVPVTGIGANPW